MITIKKIEIYVSYAGDVDAWGRVGRRKEKMIEEKDWYVLHSLLQDLTIIKNGLASDEFVEQVDEKLRQECDCGETIAFLRNLTLKNN